MAESPTSSDELDDSVQFIYEPVTSELEQVVDNLGTLARQAQLTGDPSLLEHAIVSGGKKVRPAITLLAGGFHPGHEDVLITMATAVELLHIATLVHDDTIDNAKTRRGQATVSNIWGDDVAVLLGDYVFAASATYVCETGNLRVVRRFSETIMELARGELAERFSTHDWAQGVDEYNLRTYNKTASLFCTAAQSGGILSGGSEEETEALNQYGYNLGMAFQIMDDILDFMGTEEELGKPVGNDLMQGTLTLPVLLFAAQHPNEDVVKRLAAGGRDESDLKVMVDMVRNSPVMGETSAVLEGYRSRANEAIAKLPDARPRQSLEALTEYVGHRRS